MYKRQALLDMMRAQFRAPIHAHRSTIVLWVLNGTLNFPLLCRETQVSQTANIYFSLRTSNFEQKIWVCVCPKHEASSGSKLEFLSHKNSSKKLTPIENNRDQTEDLLLTHWYYITMVYGEGGRGSLLIGPPMSCFFVNVRCRVGGSSAVGEVAVFRLHS